MSDFRSLFSSGEIPAPIARALESLSFTQATPIQAQSIPVALTGSDLIGCAQTGTGKTAAFCIPTLVHLLNHPQATALVLVPTRELAIQIEQFWISLTRFVRGAGAVPLIGGLSMHGQIQALRTRRPRLYVATPGRLCDHLNQGTLKLDTVQILILDEADRMLDMGFAPQLSRIEKALPRQRQTLFFSATWAPEVDQLSAKYLRNPARVSVGTTNQAAPKVRQSVLEVTNQGKNERLLDELNQRQGSVLVFARTQARTDRVAKYLNNYGLEVGRIHGGRTQGQRLSALQGFRSGKTRILVATDIAARGIDVTGIGHVINYDLPQQPEDYIHRIGRTGRAGAEGEAVSLVTPEDRSQWKAIQRLLLKKEGGQAASASPASSQERTSSGQPSHRRGKFNRPNGQPRNQGRPGPHPKESRSGARRG